MTTTVLADPSAPPPMLDDVLAPPVIVTPVDPAPVPPPPPPSAGDVAAPILDDKPQNIIPTEPTATPKAPMVKKEQPQTRTAYDVNEKPKKKTTKKKSKSTPKAPAPATSQDILGSLLPAPTGDVLTLWSALQETYRHNPSLRAARADVKAVYEKLPQASANFQPRVDANAGVNYLDVDPTPGSSNDGTEKTVGITATQPLYRGGRTWAEWRVADALVDAQLASLAATERQILYRAAEAYMDTLRAKAVVNVNELNRDAIARQLKATRDRFRVGDLTRTDVAQAEFRLASAEADLTAATGAYRTARATFTQLTGLVPEFLTLPTDVTFPVPPTPDEASGMAEVYNPDVIVAQATERAAAQGIDVVAGGLWPEVNLQAGLGFNRDLVGGAVDDSDTRNVGVTVTMPLYEGGAIRSRVREAKHQANRAQMLTLNTKRAVREEAIRSYENLRSAQAELTSRLAQVNAAEIARAGVKREADLGQRTILDTLDADREVRDAQIALITAKRNEIVAEFALASAVGQLIPANVGVTEPVFDTDRFGWRVLTSGLSTAVDLEPLKPE